MSFFSGLSSFLTDDVTDPILVDFPEIFEPKTLEETLGLVVGGVTIDRASMVDDFNEYAIPPPLESTALALSIKLKSSRSLLRALRISSAVSSPKTCGSWSLVNASSLFLKRCKTPRPFN